MDEFNIALFCAEGCRQLKQLSLGEGAVHPWQVVSSFTGLMYKTETLNHTRIHTKEEFWVPCKQLDR